MKLSVQAELKYVVGGMNCATTNAVFVNDRRSIRNGITYSAVDQHCFLRLSSLQRIPISIPMRRNDIDIIKDFLIQYFSITRLVVCR